MENLPDWHGKPLKKGEETQKAIAELTAQLKPSQMHIQIPKPSATPSAQTSIRSLPTPPYKLGDSVATREAFGAALAQLGDVHPLVVALDADVKNSTYTDKFGKKFPDRFFENFIAEQNMLGAAAGLAACGKIPFVATFAAFFTRAYDFIRMAAISQSNIKLVGTHVGVSIGEDGPSQMGLEDIAMMAAQPGVVVLYPSDATCTYRLVEAAASHKGMVYLRAGRPKSPVIYGPEERFQIGGSKVVRQSRLRRPHDRRSGRDTLRSAQGLRSTQGGGNFRTGDRSLQHRANRPHDLARQCPSHQGSPPHRRGPLRPRRAGRRRP